MTIIDPTPQQVLDLEIGDNDSGEPTVRGYLTKLLLTLWLEQDGFSGKRPFGNSGWSSDFDRAFIRAGWVTGEISDDEWEEVQHVDSDRVDSLVASAITALGNPS
jgi:hypothetical protein